MSPDPTIAAVALGVIVILGGLLAIMRGVEDRLRQIVQDLGKPIIDRVDRLEKVVDAHAGKISSLHLECVRLHGEGRK